MDIAPIKKFDIDLMAAPDKSITHRAVMLNAAAEGTARISRGLLGEDCLATIDCMRRLGAKIDLGEVITVTGGPLVSADLYVGNSGTTMRLLTGLLAGRTGGRFTLDGDDSIRRRPMGRVIAPLTRMGGKIGSREGYAPLSVEGAALTGIEYDMPVASAQVKSAILLAGLSASCETVVREAVPSRDHTERMLLAQGADLTAEGGEIRLRPGRLRSVDVEVAGDISSAAYPLVLAACVKGGRALVRGVGVNPTRTGILDVLRACGAHLRLFNERGGIEPIADIELCQTGLRPFTLDADIMPRLIDEVPVLAALACFIPGTSIIKGAGELRVKESDRIVTTAAMLRAFGADVEETADGLVIRGGKPLGPARVDSFGDHRIAMSAAVAGAAAAGVTIIRPECAAVSYPGFYRMFGEGA